MTKLPKFVLLLLLIALTTALCFGGGGGQKQTPAQSGGRPTLTLGVQQASLITDYKNNYYTQYLENLNNVNIDFYMLPTATTEVITKVSLMVASNDLPDILMCEGIRAEARMDYGSNGAFLDLKKYLDDPAKAPNWAKITKADKDQMLESMVSADGGIYGLARYEPTPWNFSCLRYWMNKTWLDKLGLKMPTTTDEFRNALIAFRDRDPNGNGLKDEIPLWGYYNGNYGENPILAIINSFIFFNSNFMIANSGDELTLDETGTKIIAPFTDPAFRQALQYLNTLFKDQTLNPAIFTNDQTQYRAVLNNNPQLVGCTTAGSVGNWTNADNNPNYLEYELMRPLKGPAGVQYTPYVYYVPMITTYITSAAKNFDVAFKFVDLLYDVHTSTISYFGEEGVDWSSKPADLAGQINGFLSAGAIDKLTLVTLTDTWTAPHAKTWRNIANRYYPMDLMISNARGELPGAGNAPSEVVRGVHYQIYDSMHPKNILPPLKYSADDAFRLAQPITDIRGYIKQSIAEFTTGVRDINNDAAWNGYLRELDNMGLANLMRTAQATWDRQRR